MTGNQKEIVYTVQEINVPEGYEVEISYGTKVIRITNKLVPGKIVIEKEFDFEPVEPDEPDDSPVDIPVIKNWDDNGNKDGNRPAAVTVRLLADGTEVILDLTQANYLRGQGIVTTLNFVNGMTSWGAFTAAYPGITDPKDMFINIRRMFNYVANTCVLTYWSRIDENLTRRYAESITDELNIWLNRLVSTGALLGARCELKAEENPDTDLVLLSALLTTTMPRLKEVIDAITDAGLRDSVIIMVGGAPVTQEFADEIGADAYTPDCGSCSMKAAELLRAKKGL
jgi:hypothetical protein